MTTNPGFENEENRRLLLLSALRAEVDEEACSRCLNELDAYIAAQIAGQDCLIDFPETAWHLDACLDCAEAYARLYNLEKVVIMGVLPEPESVPAPDLGFILASAPFINRLSQAIQQLGDRTRLQLSPDLMAFMQPLPGLAPIRGSADAERYDEVLLRLEPGSPLRSILPLTLTVYRDAHQPGTCLVEAVLEPIGRGWPDLAGNTVTLISGSDRYDSITDAWGQVAFKDIPIAVLPTLTIEFYL
jgi:hypothetical protein